MNIKRLFWRTVHFLQRMIREAKVFGRHRANFGWKIAAAEFMDGMIPPGKSAAYIQTIEQYVDAYVQPLVQTYQQEKKEAAGIVSAENNMGKKIPIWCCWWQGKEKMPELVRLCHDRLQQVIPEDKAELHLITLDNYESYAELPEHIMKKFEQGIITMTTLSDVLRFHLLCKYGGYWLDATVFFTGDIPQEYFTGQFFCQRMADPVKCRREACKGNWCGFSMAGSADHVIFRYMKDAFSMWWKDYDDIVDYVLIDYLLLSGYKYIPEITKTINSVPDNNEDIFEMYQVLNQPYSEELYERVTRKNVMHKLTYKMELHKETEDGQRTLYGYLMDMVYGK